MWFKDAPPGRPYHDLRHGRRKPGRPAPSEPTALARWIWTQMKPCQPTPCQPTRLRPKLLRPKEKMSSPHAQEPHAAKAPGNNPLVQDPAASTPRPCQANPAA
jgi:hypothetical protein